MPTGILALLMAAIEEAPTLISDAEALFNSVAHGEGGVAKVQSVASALSSLSSAAASAASTAQAAKAAS